MPDLGSKFECFNCGAKFYDLAKSEPICPQCSTNQKDAKDDADTKPEVDAATVARSRAEADDEDALVDDEDAALDEDEEDSDDD